MYGVKPDMSQLKVNGSTAYAVLPPQIDGKGDFHTEIGRYMGFGKAGVLFLPGGGRTIVERKCVTVVESQAPLCGKVAAPVEAVPLQPPMPQWPVDLHNSPAELEAVMLFEVPSNDSEHQEPVPGVPQAPLDSVNLLDLLDGVPIE
jgi:hypothetical protein